MKNKVVVIYASCGEGHKRAAEGLSNFIGCEAYDLLDFSPVFISRAYSWGYRYIVRHFPFLWLWFFETTKWRLACRALVFVHRILFRRFMRFVLRGEYRIVISTHFFSPPLLTKVKRKRPFLNTVLVTDLDVHPLWIDEGIDNYFVALDETAHSLQRRGIDRERIVVSGMPLRRGFYQPQDRNSLKKKFEFGEKPCLLFFSSDTGTIPFLPSVAWRLEKDFTLLVIYGKNRRIRRFVESRRSSSLRGFSRYEQIWEMMSLCTALITKPGGMTVSEALHLRKPLIFTHFIWGQEKKNMEILVRKGVAFYAPRPRELLRIVGYIRTNAAQIEKRFAAVPANAYEKVSAFVTSHIQE